ncbi:hypothetical protein SD909_000893 [Vibrio parahaemolyticus]|nr:hypothetical protein [Vibrio parahaemolyticus]
MKDSALLILDIQGSSSLQRDKISEYLKFEDWKEICVFADVWKCSFKESVSRETAVEQCNSDVLNAMKYAGISNYRAVIKVGDGDISVLV